VAVTYFKVLSGYSCEGREKLRKKSLRVAYYWPRFESKAYWIGVGNLIASANVIVTETQKTTIQTLSTETA
jgi:hypothetical protein